MFLLQIAVAPAIIGLVYIFIRDKYEKEPLNLLFTGVIFGIYSTAVVWVLGVFLEGIFYYNDNKFISILLDSFIYSAFIEEFVKFIFIYFIDFHNYNFNEPFDGIVYSVFISLGFAMTENIIYVFNPYFGGFETAISRAIFSVPAHGLFGVIMGCYMGDAKFRNNIYRFFLILKSIFITVFYHGIYNFILMINFKYYNIIFIPYVLFLWINGVKKIKKQLLKSPFKKIN